MTTTILTGDCRSILPTLPAASVQCCVTSPPYFGLRDYGVSGQIGMEASPDAFVAEMVAVFREVRRVLRDDGTLWLNLGDSYNSIGHKKSGSGYGSTGLAGGKAQVHHPLGRETGDRSCKHKDLLMIPAQVALALRADGWWLRSDIIWSKPNPMPESVTDRPTSAHEHVFLLTKSARYFFDAEAVREQAFLPPGTKRTMGTSDNPNGHGQFGRVIETDGHRNVRNVWTIATQPFSEAHFATFPPALAERCIKAGTSERGCCAACGAPWVRIVHSNSAANKSNERIADYDIPGLEKGSSADRVRRLDGKNYSHVRQATNDWAATCECGASVVPCTVLDPFAGAFTSLLVADRLQRHGIGIELNPDYAAMAKRRVEKDAGLFADVVGKHRENENGKREIVDIFSDFSTIISRSRKC